MRKKDATEEDRERAAVQALEVLRGIEAGRISLSTQGETWKQVYDGMLYFLAGNGWRFIVYLDAGRFDYFDSIQSVDGTLLDWDWIADHSLDLFNWRPDKDELWKKAPPNSGPLAYPDGDY